MTKDKGLFNDSNKIKSSFVTWGQAGDFFVGALMSKREVDNNLPDKKGEKQIIYEFRAHEGSFHRLDDKKQPIKDATTMNAGEVWSLGGKAGIDAQMRNVKIGQVCGMKFIEELPSKTKGFNPTKVIQVYTSGEMDSNFLEGAGEAVADDGEEMA